MEKQQRKVIKKNDITEEYKPYLIHPSIYSILKNQIIPLPSPQRNVLLSMNQYEINKINPNHPNDLEAPTHVIFFCIRLITDDSFQPIGGLLTYKHVDQSKTLADCIRGYIYDLWKMNLHVVATISPPFKIFRDILKHLFMHIEIEKNLEVISYSVGPIVDIIHIFDIQYLILELQNSLQAGDILFRMPHKMEQTFVASWNDILVTLNVAPEFKMLKKHFCLKENVQRRVHIFTEQIFTMYSMVKSKGELSLYSDGCLELLSAIRSFLIFFEQDYVNPLKFMDFNWSHLIYILDTMKFQKKDTNSDDNKFRNEKTDECDIRAATQENRNEANDCVTSFMEKCQEQLILDVNKRGFGRKANIQKATTPIQTIRDVKLPSEINKAIREREFIDCKFLSDQKTPGTNFENLNVVKELQSLDLNSLDFIDKSLTNELICTVKSIKKLMKLMVNRRVALIKSDALVVEHVDFLTYSIQCYNKVESARYYGHHYKFMDRDLAFLTLENTKGLNLISKD